MKIKLTNVVFFFKRKLLTTIMKIFVFLLCTTVFSFTPNNVFSQNSKIKIRADETLTVDEVFDLIMDQTNYKFIYREGIFKDLPSIVVQKGTISTNMLLKKSLSVGNVNIIVMEDNMILVKDVSAMQQIQASGKVTDQSGLPIIGATVLLKGTSSGVVTDFDGKYTITVPDPANVLVFSSLGFKNLEVTVGSKTVINVTLEEDVSELDEVVIVSTGYQTTKREKTTGNVSVISQKQIENRITTDVTSRLEGITSGLLLSNEVDGEPTIIIGGQTTFSTDKQPLIVVDGFPISGGINSINPNDIATISVLKDAAASAIWGTKSSNGVVVITTKSGLDTSNGSFNVSYSSDLIVAERPNFDNLNQASASDMVDFRNELLSTGIYTDYQYYVNPDASGWLKPFDDAYVRLNGAPLFNVAPTWNQTQYDARINELRQVDRLSEIRENLYRTTFTQRHNFSVTGGSEKNKLFFSALYQENPSKNVGNDKNTYSFNLKNYLQVSNKLGLELGATVAFNEGNQNNTIGDNILFGTDLVSYGAAVSMFDQNGNLTPTSAQVNQTRVDYYDNLGFVKSTTNPVEQIAENDNTFKNLNLRLRAKLDYDITPWLNASGSYSYERIDNSTRNHQTPESYGVRAFKFRFTSINQDDSLLESFPVGGILTEGNTLITTEILRGQLNIDKAIGENHNVTAVLGMETRAQDLKGRTDTYYGYDDSTLIFDTSIDIVDWNVNGRPTFYGSSRFNFTPQSISINQEREASYYANAVYSFKNKYIVSGSARIDQANLFGAAKKFQYAPLWSAGLAYNIHKESFFNVPWVTSLKPKITVGYNARADRNTTTELVLRANSYQKDYKFDYRQYLGIATRPNPLLTWEKTYTVNTGVDFGLFHGKLFGSIDYYSKKSEDLIVEQLVNTTYGFSSATTNNGTIVNKGIDINLTGKIIDNPNFGWTSNLLYSHNKNEIKSIDARLTQARFIVEQDVRNSSLSRAPQKGYPVDAIFSWKYAGLDATGDPHIFVDPSDPNSETANYNEIGALDVKSVVFSGQLTPKHYGGFINSFRYKNFNVNASISYKFGHVFRRPSYSYDGAVERGVATNDIATRWMQAGDENNTDVPGLQAIASYSSYSRNDVQDLYTSSDKTIEKADNIRLNNISLNYNIPVEKMGISNIFKSVSITTQVNNIGILWKATKSNFDPEFTGKNSFSGLNYFNETFPSRLKQGKEIIFAIKANF